jgi:hypothetical protein
VLLLLLLLRCTAEYLATPRRQCNDGTATIPSAPSINHLPP